MISFKYKFVFVHIPRTAGTSIESVLMDDSCILRPEEWDVSRVRETPLNHLTLRQIVDHGFMSPDTLDEFFTFCFTRNPWDRAVSEMFFLHRAGLLEEPDYRDRLLHLCQIDSYGNHVRPQYDFVALDTGIGIDFVGRYENLQADFNRVCDIIGLPRKSLPMTNSEPREPYWKYFDAETRRAVSDKYRIDREVFDYEFI